MSKSRNESGSAALGLSYLAYSKKKFLPLATEAVGQFHSRFRQGQDDLIYDEADAGWWKATDRATSEKFFSRLRRKLGTCEYSWPLGWRVDTNTTGTFISLGYQAACSRSISPTNRLVACLQSAISTMSSSPKCKDEMQIGV
jgi:hypothetical protein